MASRAWVFAALGCCCAPAFAQWNPEVPGTGMTIDSVALREERTVHVVLPDGYDGKSNTRYDVLYVLDAEDDGKRMLEIVRYLQERQGFIPPLIIVNVWTIARWDRDNNFTPTFVSGTPTSGGAAHFLVFLRDELIPYIDKHYATSGENTLYGHSYGGLFAMYAMLEAPALFRSYVLTDPSLDWDGGHISLVAKKKLANPALAGRTLWIGGRDGRDHIKMGGAEMDRVLRAHAPAGLHWRSEQYADETHFSVLHKSAYDGIKFTYSGFPGQEPLDFLPTAGVVDQHRPFPFLVDSLLPRHPPVRFTADGTEPTTKSAALQATNKIRLSGGANSIIIKSFGYHSRHDHRARVDFTLGDIRRAAAPAEVLTPGGLKYSYFEGEWDRLPDFSQLRAVTSGVADDTFFLSRLPRSENFAVLLEGFIEVAVTGYYIFVLSSDDGSKLFVGEHAIIDHDGLHGPWESKNFMLPLEKGLHPIRLEYFQRGSGAHLQLQYITPGSDQLRTIPTSRQFR